MQIAVCSWSYRLSAERVAEEMSKCEVKNVHLALNPFVDPLAVVPGTAGETENVAGTGGVDSLDKQRADIEEYLASGRWKISSTLHNSRYDDYSTLESIRKTGGLVPDEHWEENRRIIADVAKLTAEWKSPYMMLHAGYIDPSDRAGHAKLTDRLKCVRDICADFQNRHASRSGYRIPAAFPWLRLQRAAWNPRQAHVCRRYIAAGK